MAKYARENLRIRNRYDTAKKQEDDNDEAARQQP